MYFSGFYATVCELQEPLLYLLVISLGWLFPPNGMDVVFVGLDGPLSYLVRLDRRPSIFARFTLALILCSLYILGYAPCSFV